MEQTGEMDAFGHLDQEKILKDHTIDFMNQLRTYFQNYGTHFNSLRKDSRQSIKVYGIAKTEADFLVFRNSLKLVVGFSKPGQVEVSFHTLSGGVYAPLRSQKNAKGHIPKPPESMSGPSGDLFDIELGLFNEAYWTFQGRRVSAPALVRFYLTEFIKNSSS